MVWDYVKQFGTKGLKATVIVEESASDYKKEDWPLGAFDFQELCEIMATVQTDRAAFVHELITAMFKDAPAEKTGSGCSTKSTRLPESIASAILFDQTVQDYRPVLPSVSVPSLLCFGRDEKLIPIAAAKHLEQTLPDKRFVFLKTAVIVPSWKSPINSIRKLMRLSVLSVRGACPQRIRGSSKNRVFRKPGFVRP